MTKQMKTFRDLKKGDEIIVKNFCALVPCDVTIDGHNYTQERLCYDEKFYITQFPHHDNGLNAPLMEFYATNGIRQLGFILNKDDYDKIETDRYKIIQE